MKKYFNLSLLLIAVLIVFFLAAVKLNSQPAAQDTSSSALIFNALAGLSLSMLFANISALAGAVLLITSLIKKYLHSNGTITIIISGAVSLMLSAFGYYTELGIFTGLSWAYIFVYSVASMLMANGLSTWGIISTVLTFFKLKVPVEK